MRWILSLFSPFSPEVRKRGALAIVGVGLILGTRVGYPQIDHFFRENFQRTLISYSTVRLVNRVTSVLKHSSVEASILGMGGTIAVGEVLDPLDDATERLSDLLTVGIWVWGAEMVLFRLYREIWPFLLLLPVAYLLFPVRPVVSLFQLLLFLLAIPPATYLLLNWLDHYFFTPHIHQLIEQIKAPLSPLPAGASFSQWFSVLKNLDSVGVTLLSLLNNIIMLGVFWVTKLLISVGLIPLLLYRLAVGGWRME